MTSDDETDTPDVPAGRGLVELALQQLDLPVLEPSWIDAAIEAALRSDLRTGPDDADLDPAGEAIRLLDLPELGEEWIASTIGAALNLVDATESAPLPRRDVAAVLRLDRRLLAAAAAGHELLHGTSTSEDGILTARFTESDDERLEVIIEAAVPTGELVVVSLTWELERQGGSDRERRRLVTPLTVNRGQARYDLGALADISSVQIGHPEQVDPAAVTAEMVRETFAFGMFGNAQRAWRDLAQAGLLDPDTAEELGDQLERLH